MASLISKRYRHHQGKGILSVLDHYSDESNISMKVGPLLRRSVSTADIRRSECDDDVNSWFAPKISESEAAPPYVHPLVKKSASAVSLKSLEACTESLGSESGSDGFSNLQEEEEDHQLINSTTTTSIMQIRKKKTNKGNPKSFPPPLSSSSYHHHHHQQGRQPLRVRSHRHLGRLVLEATTFPLHLNNFKAHRQDGRLLLAFTHNKNEEEEDEDTKDDLSLIH